MTSSRTKPETDLADQKPGRSYKFSVNDKPYESDEPILTGTQIKVKASIDPADALFLEGRRGEPDRQIGDGETVDLREPGREKFYTMPAANFGAPLAHGRMHG